MNNNLGGIIKQQRKALDMTLKEISEKSGVSPSYLGRIERGERFPSGYILRKLAKPLRFGEEELLRLAGFLSPVKKEGEKSIPGRLDPVVAGMLAEEPLEIQRAVIGLLSIIKVLAQGITSQ